MRLTASLVALLLPPLTFGCGSSETTETGRAHEVEEELVLRVATFNVEDLRTSEIQDSAQPRVSQLAAILQEIRPDIVLINEIAYDQAGAPGWVEGQEPGQNGQRFADFYLAEPQGQGLEPIRYEAFMRPVNTGVASGLDLDNDGRVSLESVRRDENDVRLFPIACEFLPLAPGELEILREGHMDGRQHLMPGWVASCWPICFDQLAKLTSARRFSSLTLTAFHRQGPSQTPVWTMLVITGRTASLSCARAPETGPALFLEVS